LERADRSQFGSVISFGSDTIARWKADVNDQPIRAWRDLAADWKVWLSLALCLLIATVAWLLGYD
jgi:hypothetical protein